MKEKPPYRRILAMLPVFCDKCPDMGDCTDSCEPIALERCQKIIRLKNSVRDFTNDITY